MQEEIEKEDLNESESNFFTGLDFTGMEDFSEYSSPISYLDRYMQSFSMSPSYKYTSKTMIDMLARPKANSNRIVDASRYLSAVSSYYMRVMYYMANMLTLDFIVVPNHLNPDNVIKDRKTYGETYMKAQYYIESFNIKHNFSQILWTMCVEDVYFGYERRYTEREKTKCVIQPLDSKYCRINGVQDGNYTFEFNVGYFGTNVELLKTYPREFHTMYKNYLETGKSWYKINPKKGICFKFREDLDYILPPFAGMLPDILDQQEIKDLQKSKNKLENFKLLLQKIPFKDNPKSEKDFLVSLPSVKFFHDNIKSALPKEIGIISSPMEIEEFSFEKRSNTLDKDASNAKKEIFDSAGVPSIMFNTSDSPNSTALLKAIEADESIMFRILRQFERFFNNRLYNEFWDYEFNLIFPDLTVYNRSSKSKEYLAMGQYMGGRALIASTMGISLSQLIAMNTLEVDVFNLDETLKPLMSSHTMTSEKESGGQTKDLGELSDKGVETRDLDTNREHKKV